MKVVLVGVLLCILFLPALFLCGHHLTIRSPTKNLVIEQGKFILVDFAYTLSNGTYSD